MKDRIKAGFLGLALVFAGLFAFAEPAQAVGVCSVDSICFYDTPGSWYPMVDHDDADTAPGECLLMGGHSNDTEYIWNRTDHQYYVWTGTGCAGTRGLIYANSSGPMTGAFSNTIDSYKRIG